MIESIKFIYEESDTRGKNRQNIINREVCEYLKLTGKYDDVEFRLEDKLSTPNSVGGKKTFDVDIAIYKEGVLIEVVLNKAPYSNICQNEQNSINSRIGETFRIVNDFPDIKITWFNFLPKMTPYFEDGGKVKRVEINQPHPICTDNFRKNISIKNEIREIFVCFDWNGIPIGSNKSKFGELLESGTMYWDNVEIIEYK